jgi:hypothetical protein
MLSRPLLRLCRFEAGLGLLAFRAKRKQQRHPSGAACRKSPLFPFASPRGVYDEGDFARPVFHPMTALSGGRFAHGFLVQGSLSQL